MQVAVAVVTNCTCCSLTSSSWRRRWYLFCFLWLSCCSWCWVWCRWCSCWCAITGRDDAISYGGFGGDDTTNNNEVLITPAIRNKEELVATSTSIIGVCIYTYFFGSSSHLNRIHHEMISYRNARMLVWCLESLQGKWTWIPDEQETNLPWLSKALFSLLQMDWTAVSLLSTLPWLFFIMFIRLMIETKMSTRILFQMHTLNVWLLKQKGAKSY